jgi:aryl-alcohol dehydrogenase-like predicted oxidoreductase
MKRRQFLKQAAVTAAAVAASSELKAKSYVNPIAQRTLGRTGEQLSIIAFGGIVVMNESPGDVSNIVAEAVDRGINYFDVAPSYGNAQERLGPALAPYRKNCFLACKTEGRMKDDSRKQLEESLQLLKTDHVDLYQFHALTKMTDLDTVLGPGGAMETMEAAKKEGKIRYIGLSEASPQTLRRAAKVHPIAALQTEYSLWTRDPEQEILATCRELGIGFVAYSPLGRGFLTGQFRKFEDLPADDIRRSSPRFQGQNFQKNLDLVRRVEQIAREKGCTPSQLALAWVHAQGKDVVPIPGTKRRKYLEDNVGALTVQLTAEDLHRIETAFPSEAVAGLRYPEPMMGLVNR